MPAQPMIAGTRQFGALARVYVLEFHDIKSHLVSHHTPDGINSKYNSMIHFYMEYIVKAEIFRTTENAYLNKNKSNKCLKKKIAGSAVRIFFQAFRSELTFLAMAPSLFMLLSFK